MRPRPVVFIVTREVRIPKKVEPTREILPDLIQWKFGKSYISFWENKIQILFHISVVVTVFRPHDFLHQKQILSFILVQEDINHWKVFVDNFLIKSSCRAVLTRFLACKILSIYRALIVGYA